MAMTVQTQCESVVTEMYQEVVMGSTIETGMTLIQFDLRNLDFQCEFGTTSTIDWPKASHFVDVHELSTLHNPINYRFTLAQGYDFNADGQRAYVTPEIKGVSTSQHYPHARFQADHFHPVKPIWQHLKKSLLSYRRQIKSRGEDQKDEDLTQLAKQLWKRRWSLLKKPVRYKGCKRWDTPHETPKVNTPH